MGIRIVNQVKKRIVNKYAGDWELVEKARKGEERAFAAIVEKYESLVANVVKGMLGNVAEADDVGQEVFIRFYHSLDRYRGDAALRTYLTRIAINLSLNELKKRRRVVSLFTEKQEEAGFSDLSDEGRDVEKKDTQEVVEAALQRLDEGFRSVVVLRLIEGYSTRETAEILNLPQGTVLSRLSRAQKQLKEILMNEKIFKP